jgi:OPT family oligopeptide transporter
VRPVLAYILGEAWAKITPHPERFKWRWLQTTLRFLDFGRPFRIKEHVIATLIASSANNGLAGIEVYAVERLFYDKTISATTAVLATFSISLCGFVLAGVLRPLVVYPAEMVYWLTLPQVILFQNLHFDREKNKERLRKFAYALGLSAVWEFFPAYIMPWLGGVSIPCLASMKASDNTRKVVGNVSGGVSANEGLGILNFSFDWQYIQSIYLSLPLKQQFNSWIGLVIFYAAMLGLYYGNAWSAKSEGIPFMSTSLYSGNGTHISRLSLVDSQGIINETKVNTSNLPHLTTSSVWGYFTQNVAIGALIVHVILFWGKDMLVAAKQARSKTQPDPHYQAMKKYKEVPMWWYYASFALAFLAGLIVTLRGETTLKPGPYIVALLLGIIIAPFSLIISGLYGDGVQTDQLSKMVAGAVVHGRPLANLYFASWSHQVILLAFYLANWLKVGQYTKIPPRVMFWTQVYATLLGAGLDYIVMIVIATSQREILLEPGGNNVWSGTYMQSLNSQAITWALAKDIYSLKGRYPIVPLGLVIGLGLPLIHWSLVKLFPTVGKIPINTAVIAAYSGLFYYGNTSWIWSSIAVGVFSQVWLRRRRPRLYNNYNYLIGAALDGGSQVVVFVLSFAVFGASGKARPFPTWFGNPSGNADHCI